MGIFMSKEQDRFKAFKCVLFKIYKDKLFIYIIVVFIISLVLAFIETSEFAQPKLTDYPMATSTYAELDSKVGCGSKFSLAKKIDIFNQEYKDKILILSGELGYIGEDVVSLIIKDIDESIVIFFSDPAVLYDLEVGQEITVKFKIDDISDRVFCSYYGSMGELVKPE